MQSSSSAIIGPVIPHTISAKRRIERERGEGARGGERKREKERERKADVR